DASSGAVLYRKRPGNVTADTIRWDAFSDDFYYYFQGARIMRHQISLNKTEIYIDYATDSRFLFTSITGGGTRGTSKDNWLGFWAPKQNSICTVNLQAKATYCANYLDPQVVGGVGVDFVDYVLMSKGVDSVSGKRYVLLMSSPALALFSVDLVAGK